MLALIRFLGLIIGDLIIDKNDKHWQLYKLLRQIIDIILSPRIVPTFAQDLELLVSELNGLYLELFGVLKPKFHHLVHYSRFLLLNGPIVNYWTMRFESRHRQLKAVATAISCNIDLLKTIAVKECLKMCHMMQTYMCDTEIATVVQKKIKNITYYTKIELNGSFYSKNTFVVIDNTDIEKIFGKITCIFKEDGIVKFEMDQYSELTFNEHIHAYEIDLNSRTRITKSYTDLPKLPPCFSSICDDNVYLVSHFRL